MKLIIDIHEKDYQSILNSGQVPYGVVYAIMNGIPLPKGHGRLIDADRLKIDNPLHLSLDIPYVTEETVEDIIDYAPTIVEADGGREDAT